MNFESILGEWGGAARAIVSGVLVYAALVTFVRISGKRTVGKWNAFDLIVTVALGSTLSSAIVSGTVPVLTGIGGLFVLVTLQFVLTWSSVRMPFIHRVVKSTPVLLVHRGELKHDIMRRERVTEAEVLAAVRRRGFGDLRAVHAVVLETDGTFSVIGTIADDVAHSTLRTVHGVDEKGM